jgi:hypothetical protein
MKILALELKAFGPFTDTVLDFGSGDGLHVVYGPNEAGKSSSLRALSSLLYGIHERTSDNFLHPNDRLLVGGTLVNGRGERLSLLRRKRRKDDLLDSAENPLPEEALAPFLCGVERDAFLMLFGIDHERLIAGGREILAQEGHIGRALFAAGTGVSSLRTISQDLAREAEELFKARGSKGSLNQAIAAFRDQLRKKKEAALSGSEFGKHTKALEHAQKDLERLTGRLRDAAAEKRKLERLLRALPELAGLDALRNDLAGLGDVPVLPEDFPDRRVEVQNRAREIAIQLRETVEQLQNVRERLGAISPGRTTLDHGHAIDSLVKGLERYAKNGLDRPVLDGKRRQLKRDAGDILRLARPDVPLEEVERLYPVLTNRKALLEAGSRERLLVQELQQAGRMAEQLEKEFETARDALSSFPEEITLEGLEVAVRESRRLGMIDAEILESSTALDTEWSSCSREWARQRVCGCAIDALPSLSIPLSATLTRFADRFARHASEVDLLARDRQDSCREQERLALELRTMELANEVPTEAELRAVRERRDKGWSLLRRQWIGGEDVQQESRDLDPDRQSARCVRIPCGPGRCHSRSAAAGSGTRPRIRKAFGGAADCRRPPHGAGCQGADPHWSWPGAFGVVGGLLGRVRDQAALAAGDDGVVPVL